MRLMLKPTYDSDTIMILNYAFMLEEIMVTTMLLHKAWKRTKAYDSEMNRKLKKNLIKPFIETFKTKKKSKNEKRIKIRKNAVIHATNQIREVVNYAGYDVQI